MPSGIYQVVCLANGRFYLGSSRDIPERWKQHLYLLQAGRHHNRIFQGSWGKYGEDAFFFEVLEECSIENLQVCEQGWLDKFFDHPECMNLAPDAFNPVSQLERTPEWCASISAALRGRTCSEATKQKLREANVGKKLSASTRAKMSEARRGRKLSKESIEKGAAKRRGRKLSPEHVESLRQAHGTPLVARNEHSGQELQFRNGAFAAEYFGCTKGAIYANIRRGKPASQPGAKLFGWLLERVEG